MQRDHWIYEVRSSFTCLHIDWLNFPRNTDWLSDERGLTLEMTFTTGKRGGQKVSAGN